MIAPRFWKSDSSDELRSQHQQPPWKSDDPRTPPGSPRNHSPDRLGHLRAVCILALDTWITMHVDLRNSPRCRVTFEALVKGLQRYVG